MKWRRSTVEFLAVQKRWLTVAGAFVRLRYGARQVSGLAEQKGRMARYSREIPRRKNSSKRRYLSVE